MDIMLIGFYTVFGQREFQPQVVGEVLDEVFIKALRRHAS